MLGFLPPIAHIGILFGRGTADSVKNRIKTKIDMAIVHNNNLIGKTTGTIGEVYIRIVRGKQIMCKRPGPGRKFTPNQLASQRRFGEISKTAKAVLKDPLIKELYQSRIDNQKFTAHMVAQSDLMKD